MKLATNLYAWSRQRFPLSQGIFIAVLYITAVFYGQLLTGTATLALGPGDIPGFGACWGVFLMLRIFDEHKDYALDLHNHPDRVLQSGRITLGHLKVLCLLAILLQAGYSMFCDRGLGIVTYYWLAIFGWSLLMKAEFFVPGWLNSHLPAYGASHMLIMLPIMGWLMQIGAPGANLTADAWWLAGMAFFAGSTYELTRKAWGAEEERDSIDSYARRFGTTGVAIAIAVTLGVAIVASIAMLTVILPSTARWAWFVTPMAGWLLVTVSVCSYAQSPTIKARKKNEAMVGLALLMAYGTPLSAMIVERGISWAL
jgi:4-hydroxybenzoate polyprenyltransferase